LTELGKPPTWGLALAIDAKAAGSGKYDESVVLEFLIPQRHCRFAAIHLKRGIAIGQVGNVATPWDAPLEADVKCLGAE
jgi:hypothetical protein